jgi:exopolysaccharide biosynthesis polyprenyl glycosylphosphotransferase
MIRQNLRILRRLNATLDLALVVIAFFLAALASARLGKDPFVVADFWGPLTLPVLLALISWAAVLGTESGLYEYRMRSFGQTLRKLALVTVKSAGLFLALLFLFRLMLIGRTTFLLHTGFTFVFLLTERVALAALLHAMRRRGYNYQAVLVVGTGKIARTFVDDVFGHPEWGVRIVGFLDWELPDRFWRYRDIPLVGELSDLGSIVQNNHIDSVVFAVPRSALARLDGAMRTCEETGTHAVLMADFFEPKIATRTVSQLAGKPVIMFSTAPPNEWGILFKGAFDRVAAAAGLVVASPVMLAAAVAIKLEDRGPVLFRQHRCGLNGRRFPLYKFRSMVPDAEALKAQLLARNEVSGAAFKMTDDPRITKVGALLRKTSIDELPQLWNVLLGHMSLVGPRPPLPDEVSRFDPWQRRKLSMKPGITGLWQVGGRSNVDFEEWMRMDLDYIDHWSLKLDAKILLKTIPAVLTREGAK